MTEDEFLKQIEPIPDYDYFYFVAADMSLRENASARAYINFCQQDDIFIFKDKFDGYVFVDGKGVEYPAIVEFAPFQGLVKIKSRKKDNKCNTIETDTHFMQFLESLKQNEVETGKQEMKLEYSYQIKDDKKITSTPLLEYIASKKQARREERRKKIDDRKKQRDDEKLRKHNQVAKNIPASIQEEDDDGIIVRTIKSRSFERGGDRTNKNKERIFESSGGKSTKSDEKHKAYREERDRRDERRKAERERRDEQRQKNRDEQSSSSQQQSSNKSRTDDRDRNRKKDRPSGGGGGNSDRGGSKGGFDRRDQRNKDDKKSDTIPSSSTKSSSTTVDNATPQPPIKEEKVKKYSESRRERFNRSAADPNKIDQKSDKKDGGRDQEKFYGKDNKNDAKFSTRYKGEKFAKEEKTVVKAADKNVVVKGEKTVLKEEQVVVKELKPETQVPKETEEKVQQKDDENIKKNADELKLLPNEMENEEKRAVAVSSPPPPPSTKMHERQSSVDDGRRSSSSGEGGSTGKDDSQMRRIRNKDRPSLQIYQPGKRRLGPSSSSSNVAKKEIDTSASAAIASDCLLPVDKESPKISPSTSLQTINDTPKVDEDAEKIKSKPPAVVASAETSKIESLPIPKDTATAAAVIVSSSAVVVSSSDVGISDEIKKSEKKVTRYSERRTRARERRGSTKSDKITTDPDEKNNIVSDDVVATTTNTSTGPDEIKTQSVDNVSDNAKSVDDIKPEPIAQSSVDTIKTDE